MKRLITLCLCLCMILPLVVGCGDNGKNDQTTTAASTTSAAQGEVTTDPAETTAGYDVKDNLPGNLDFGGRTISIVSRGRSWCADEVSVESLTGDLINDAIYNRNMAVQDRLNVVIANQLTSGTDNYEITEMIRKQVQSGSNEYDLFANSVYSTIMYTADNLFQDMANLTYLDLSMPYWSQGFNEAASIGGAQYFVSGPICLAIYRFVFATFFNKAMFDENKIPYLYDVVDKGEWTLEYQRQISSNIYNDLNGNGDKDAADRYGFVTNHDMIGVDAYWSSCKLDILTKDADNYLVFNVNNEKLSNAVDKINQLIWDNEGAFRVEHASSDSEQETIANMFAQDQAAMVTLRLIAVEGADMRDMKSAYGIVPMPKLDADQDGYGSYAHDTMTAYGIPLTTVDENLDQVGAFLEAMAAESYRTVMPAYYEVALKTKYVSDEESVRMLDMVMDNFYVDPGVLYTKQISSFHQKLRTWIGTNRNTVASQTKSVEKIIKKQVEALNEGIAKLVEQ